MRLKLLLLVLANFCVVIQSTSVRRRRRDALPEANPNPEPAAKADPEPEPAAKPEPVILIGTKSGKSASPDDDELGTFLQKNDKARHKFTC